MQFQEEAAWVLLRYGSGQITFLTALRELNVASKATGETAAEQQMRDADAAETRAEWVARVVRDAQEPITRGEVIEELRRRGDEPSEQVVSNTLGKLVRAGSLSRLHDGQGYQFNNNGCEE